jgi:hypothetical protein
LTLRLPIIGFVPSLSFLPTSTVYATAYGAGMFQPGNRSWGSLRFVLGQPVQLDNPLVSQNDVVRMGCPHTPRQRSTLRSFSLRTSVPKTSSEPLHMPLIIVDVPKGSTAVWTRWSFLLLSRVLSSRYPLVVAARPVSRLDAPPWWVNPIHPSDRRTSGLWHSNRSIAGLSLRAPVRLQVSLSAPLRSGRRCLSVL